MIDLAFSLVNLADSIKSIRYFFRRALTKLRVTLRNPPLVVRTQPIIYRLQLYTQTIICFY